jgi:Xaa-Pro dipeptidase
MTGFHPMGFVSCRFQEAVMQSGNDRRQFLRSLACAAAFGVSASSSSFGRTRRLRLAAMLPDAMPDHDRLQPDWYRRKVSHVQEQMKQRKLNALVLLHATNVIYTVGYFHLSTERPLAVLIPESGDPALFIPELESDQVKLWWVKDYEAYFDFPGPVNRVRWIFERVAKRGFGSARIGVEEASPSRTAQIKLGAPNATIVEASNLIDEMRWVKDEDELRMMRRSMYFADFTVQAGREFVQKNGGVTEDQILKGTADALADKMSKELKDVVGVSVEAPFGGLVPFGTRSAFPHAVPSKDRLKPGDALILSYGACVGGYNVECERAFSVGKPTDYAKRLYDAMLAAHDTAAENMKEGAIAEDVDKRSLDQIRKAGFEKFLKHRTGHGIGLEGHEPPWIAEGDKTVLKQGMTFSCEPGVYDPNWGGFRHSDTVVVGKDKGEILNTYPTRLEDMIIEI